MGSDRQPVSPIWWTGTSRPSVCRSGEVNGHWSSSAPSPCCLCTCSMNYWLPSCTVGPRRAAAVCKQASCDFLLWTSLDHRQIKHSWREKLLLYAQLILIHANQWATPPHLSADYLDHLPASQPASLSASLSRFSCLSVFPVSFLFTAGLFRIWIWIWIAIETYIQNSAAHLLTHTGSCDHITPVL